MAPRRSLPSIASLVADWDGRSHLKLPDPLSEQGGIPWAAGALDGVRLHHGGLDPGGAIDAATLVAAARRLAANSSDDAREAFYAAALACDPLGVADELVRLLADQPAESLVALRPHARWLVEVAAHVPALRIGLVLLGVVGTPADLPAALALSAADEPDPALREQIDQLLKPRDVDRGS